MTHSKDIPLDPKALDWAGIDDAFHVGLSHYTNVSLPNSVAKPLHDWIESQRASLRPAADPKAEAVGCVLGMGLQLLSEGYSATIWPVASVSDVQDDTVHPLFAAPPTPDAERAGPPPVAWRWRYIYPTGPGGWHLRASMVEATPSTKWECEREVEPLYASQSPATEAVRVKPLEWRLFSNSRNASGYALGRQEYFILYAEVANRFRVYGIPGPHDGSAEYTTQDEAKAAAQSDYEQRILSALIRPPVNNSPGGEQVVADVSKAAAVTEAMVERALAAYGYPGYTVPYGKQMRKALEAALSPKAAAYYPAIIHFDEGRFDEFVTEDVATITGDMRAADIEPIFRMAAPRDLIGYRIYDAAPPADTEGATKP